MIIEKYLFSRVDFISRVPVFLWILVWNEAEHTRGAVLTLRHCVSASARLQPQVSGYSFVVGVREGVVRDRAFGRAHEITANVCFGRTLGVQERDANYLNYSKTPIQTWWANLSPPWTWCSRFEFPCQRAPALFYRWKGSLGLKSRRSHTPATQTGGADPGSHVTVCTSTHRQVCV